MGFNLKEKLQNANKKNVLIVALILLGVIGGSIGGYEYYQYRKFKTQKMKSQEMMPVDISGEPKRPSEYNIGIEYNKAMKTKKPVMALFYADWCGYCIRFMPVFQAISEKYAEDMVFTKVNVEDKDYEELVKEMRIGGFPTVFLLDSKYDNKVLISNSFLGSVDDLSGEIDRFLKIRKLLDKKK